MAHRMARDIDSDNAIGDARKHGRTVALAGSKVEDVSAMAKLTRQQVPMPMFQLDVTLNARHITLVP
jgi:hypothetical protein